MYKKLCDRCYQLSFSSSEFGEWLCPSCNKDITKGKLYEATEKIVRPYTQFKSFTKSDVATKPTKIDTKV
ncbi:hypothetical protein [Litchfieldia alkalitelluris]|uniref:hypothetical protein n=1 Tax=Litchfieldia alkalitelluris TaxID=304268 RepID=UPI000997FEB8|nr:hypothetical protein [Litchfieldia alkalitelluris]